MSAGDIEKQRQAVGSILDEHARAVIDGRGAKAYRWNKGEYVLRLEKSYRRYFKKRISDVLKQHGIGQNEQFQKDLERI